MPIQIISTVKKIPPPPIDLITAGADQQSICDVLITLQAVVDPILNLPGHTLLWEQVSGSAVILSDPTALITTFSNLAKDDRIFKFTVDQGLPTEQVATVSIFDTPTSRQYGSFSNMERNKFVPSDAVPCSSIIFIATASVPTPLPPHNDDRPAIETIEIQWDLPPDPSIQPLLTLMTLYENGVPVQTYTLADIRTYDGSRSTYQVLSEFNINGNLSSELSCLQDFTNIPAPAMRVIDDTLHGTAFSSADITKQLFGNIIQTEITNAPSSFVNPDIILTKFINKVQEITDSFTSAFSSVDVVTTRSDPGGIGG